MARIPSTRYADPDDEDFVPKRRGRPPVEDEPAPRRSATRKVAKTPAHQPRTKASITEDLRPIRQTMGQTEFIGEIQDRAADALGRDVTPKEAKIYKKLFEDMILASIMPKSCGKFVWPGMFIVEARKIPARKVPARKAGMQPNPFKGGALEHMEARAAFTKPATVKAKLRPARKIKLAAIGE